MPEIKHNFTSGKMNKDLDERLVPNGQYRDALNIQVSTSEDSDVGTIQNILGNNAGCAYKEDSHNPIPNGSKTVGSISDEKNDTLYWLVSGPEYTTLQQVMQALNSGEETSLPIVNKDLIMRYNSYDGCEPIFVDKWGLVISNTDNATVPGDGNITNSVDDNILVIEHQNSFNDIHIGMNVTAFDASSGITSNTTIVTGINSVGTIASSITLGYDSGMSNASGPVPHVILDCESDTGGGFSPTGTVYVRSNNPAAISAGVGDTMKIYDGSTLITVPNTTIVSKEEAKIWDSTNTVYNDYYVIVLNQSFDVNWFDPATQSLFSPTDIQDQGGCPTAGTTGCGVQIQYYSTGLGGAIFIPTGPISQAFFGSFTWTYVNPTATINGNIYLPSTSPWIDNLVSGMVVEASFWFPNGGCIDIIDIPNNMFTVDDCAGTQIIPANYNPGSEWISIQTGSLGDLNTIVLDTNITMSTMDFPYLYFRGERVLNFNHNRLITGINIIDDMLFWTDNFTEPKKINIPRSRLGTDIDGNIHTKLVNESLNINPSNIVVPIKEEHITVVRKAPKNPLILDFITGREVDKQYTGITTTAVDPSVSSGVNLSSIIKTSFANPMYDFSSVSVGDTVRFIIDTNINSANDFTLQWKPGDTIVLKEFSNGAPPPIPISDYRIKGKITNWGRNTFYSILADQDLTVAANDVPASYAGTAHVEMEVTSIKGYPPQPSGPPDSEILRYAVDLFQEEDRLFEFKFPRFSYRYKYEDGEYSTFAPFSEVAFVHGGYDLQPKKGYNLGMTNLLKSVRIKNFITDDMPKDVVEIDILYKDDASPTIYIVDTISPKDEAIIEDTPGAFFNSWNLNEYTIDREIINAVLPSNQLLRPWDNVPKKALAQEVSGNRLIYGNYEQNYNLDWGGSKFKPTFISEITSFQHDAVTSRKSIKSLREYQLGVVFTDKYGRETPVLSNNTGLFKLNKNDSFNNNRLRVGFDNPPPPEFKYFKFFIKETSGEYYNLAMDRWYDAEDGNLWLAFPSSERNKVDIDTFLILKKASVDVPTTGKGRYNILAIENEAPDYIKTKRLEIGNREHSTIPNDDGEIENRLFGTIDNELDAAPEPNKITFAIKYAGFGNSSLAKLDENTNGILHIRFEYNDGNYNDRSNVYRISELTSDRNTDPSTGINAPTEYFLTLEEPLGEEVSFIFDDPTGPSRIRDGVRIRFYRYLVENSAKFDGRFFVKIYNDDNVKQSISDLSVANDYRVDYSKMVYLLSGDSRTKQTHSRASYSGQSTQFNNVEDSFSSQYGASVDDCNIMHARAAFFGEIQASYIGGASTPYGVTNSQVIRRMPKSQLDIHYKKTGVWFINESFNRYTQSGQGLYYGKCDPMQYFNQNAGHMSGINYTTSTSATSRIDLAFGGIEVSGGLDVFDTENQGNNTWDVPVGVLYSEDMNISNSNANTHYAAGKFEKFLYDNGAAQGCDVGLDAYAIMHLPFQPNFFNIGEVDGNSNYDDNDTVEFVDRIDSGFSFMWEDDPTQTIYEIMGQEKIMLTFWGKYESNLPYGAYKGEGGGSNEVALAACPANYQKNFRFWCKPAMNGWNPTENWGGYISEGLKLGGVVAATEASTSTGAGVNLITTTTANPNIKPGMVVAGDDIQAGTVVVSIDALNISDITISKPTSGTVSSGSPLEFGYTIRIISSDTSDIKDPWVKVDFNIAMCEKHLLKFPLKEGMVISEYNDAPVIPDTNPQGKSNLLIKSPPEYVGDGYVIHLTGYINKLVATDFGTDSGGVVAFAVGEKIVFRQACMNSVSNFTEKNTDLFLDYHADGGIGAVGYEMNMVTPDEVYENEGVIPEDPFIWETEPKESEDLDIYYEISGTNPIRLDIDTVQTVLPIGSKIKAPYSNFPSTIINNISPSGDIITISSTFNIGGGMIIEGEPLIITRPDGTILNVKVTEIIPTVVGGAVSNTLRLSRDLLNSLYTLNWYNCYSFGNGVESNRIRDSFNLPFIAQGVIASTTASEQYKQERRKSGLIYSGIYNSTSGINNLNQFIQAEKITKDINPIYGSIQKLHARDTNLITLCEDKCLKILANKDAVFNADGNPNLVATENVLGQTTPFVGEYGISKNPESFASESYRAYFTDKQRGAVMRLSMDGLTPISEHGMKDWFRDNLKLVSNEDVIIGSYDDRQGEYNITSERFELERHTVSFQEKVKGWISFKSFVPENGISCTNDYFTFLHGNLYKHHHEGSIVNPHPRNTFYGTHYESSFNVILNDAPSSVKSFNTLNYEGSQSKIDSWDTTSTFDGDVVNNAQPYNLNDVAGWYVKGIKTDQEVGSLNEFIKKEGKWFNYIKGVGIQSVNGVPVINSDGSSTFDVNSFAIQGLGRLDINPIQQGVQGCMDSTMFNYDSTVTIPLAGSCIPFIFGCLDVTADNYNDYDLDGVANALTLDVNIDINTDDGSCIFSGCTDSTAVNYNSNANFDNGSCIATVLGCTDPTAFNYNSNANTDDGSCAVVVSGCIDPTANNYNSTANTDDGSCTYTISGCTDSIATNYNSMATNDDGSCVYSPYGCTDSTASNYNSSATIDDGSCIPCIYGCTNPLSSNYDSTATCDDGSCLTVTYGCTDPTATNYNAGANVDDGSCVWFGCMDSTADNYDSTATIDPGGTCFYTVMGCIDPNACNTDVSATVDDGSCEYVTCAGCMDPAAQNNATVGSYNYQTTGGDACLNPNGNTGNCTIACGDGTDSTSYGTGCCTYDVLGCMDTTSCNYDSNATVDYGCDYTSCAGCMDSSFNNYNSNATIACDYNAPGNQCCNNFVYGCTDPTACNYDILATDDNGSCQYTVSNYNITAEWIDNNTTSSTNLSSIDVTFDVASLTPFGGSGYVRVQLLHPTNMTTAVQHIDVAVGALVLNGNQVTFNNVQVFLAPYNNPAEYVIRFIPFPMGNFNACSFVVSPPFFFTILPCVPDGCIDSTACNYNSNATCSDGSCYYGTAALWYADANGCYIGPSCDPGTLGIAYPSDTLCCLHNPGLCD